MLERHLVAIFRALNAANVKYLVVGGVAVTAHGHPRYTADLDLVVALDEDNATRALHALIQLGYAPTVPVRPEDFAIRELRERWIHEKRMMVFQMRSEQQPETTIDLFVREPFDFTAEFTRAPRFELVPNELVPVVTFDSLIAMKKEAGRPLDLDDIKNLLSSRSGNFG